MIFPLMAAVGLLTESEPPKVFEAAFEYDFNSAYVWRSAVQNDQPVMQPCVWADVTYFEPFWFGGFVWQNYNLTDRNAALYRYGLSETDYGVYGGATLWTSSDKAYSVWAEIGHDWFTYPGVREGCEDLSPDARELTAKMQFENPFVDVYGSVAWMYEDFGLAQKGFYYEAGLRKEVEIAKSLSAGADWCVSFGDSAAMADLYGGCDYDKVTGEVSNPDAGIGGTTVKLYLVWHVTDWLSLGCTIAYTGVLNGSARQGLADRDYYGDEGCWNDGTGDLYPRDLLWGGINLKLIY